MSPTTSSVTFEQATCLFEGQDRPAVDRLDLTVEPGELLVLVGPSGCGKSTSLRMLAGLEEVTTGRVLIGPDDITDLAPQERDVAMVFQNYALYPHMTVAANLAFALEVAGMSKHDVEARVKEAAALLEIDGLLDRRPAALSGGQRQRVAMGRAIVRHPRVFLLDEPLSNLDAQLRVQTRTQIAELQRRLGVTTIYVTHDQVEAMTMGDRVAVMDDGVLQQCARPREMYDRPANRFVAGFLGSPAMNLVELPVHDDAVVFGTATIPLDRSVLAALDASSVVLGVRPENLASAEQGIDVVVDVVEELGADAFAYGHADDGSRLVTRVDWRRSPVRGERLRLAPAVTGPVHAFSAVTGDRLG